MFFTRRPFALRFYQQNFIFKIDCTNRLVFSCRYCIVYCIFIIIIKFSVKRRSRLTSMQLPAPDLLVANRHHWGLSWFHAVPPRQFGDSAKKQTKGASYCVPPVRWPLIIPTLNTPQAWCVPLTVSLRETLEISQYWSAVCRAVDTNTTDQQPVCYFSYFPQFHLNCTLQSIMATLFQVTLHAVGLRKYQ